MTSGIINAVESDVFVKSSRPLSIAGISGHSYGHKLSREDRRLPQTELERHFPDLAQRIDTRTGSNLESLVAIEMAVLEEQVLRERWPVHFDRRRLAWAMAATINESPSRYDDTKTAILALMREFEIDESELEIPPPQLQPPAPPDGAHLVGPRRVFFVFDGNRIGLTTVADAVEASARSSFLRRGRLAWSNQKPGRPSSAHSWRPAERVSHDSSDAAAGGLDLAAAPSKGRRAPGCFHPHLFGSGVGKFRITIGPRVRTGSHGGSSRDASASIA